MRLPLEDVTVIDLSHALAGPFCSTRLADFGARVIKLEPKGAGDVERADVVVENYRTGALERLGLAYAKACRRNPGIIYCSVSGFGS